MISKTLISGQKPRGRQLNAKACDSKSSFFLRYDFCSNNDNSKTASTKRMLITACSFPTTQRLHSLKFTLVNKSHYNTVVGCCIDSIYLRNGIGNISRDSILPYSVALGAKTKTGQSVFISDFVMLDLFLAVSLLNFIDSYLLYNMQRQ